MSPEERQRARDRAADGVALQYQVIVPRSGWSASNPHLIGLSPTEKRRYYRERTRAVAS